MTEIRRCNAAERAKFGPAQPGLLLETTEPALGTLAERLDIIIRRQGGRTKAPTATNQERRDYAAWLRANDPTAVNPYDQSQRAAGSSAA
jgi:hypothetical protein